MSLEEIVGGGYAYQKLRKLGLSDKAAFNNARHTTIQSFRQNQHIWKKGSVIESWICVINGLVCASVATETSESTPISLYGEDTWFGEFSILSRKPAYANFTCMVPTDVLSMPAELVIELLNIEQGFAAKVAKMVAWRAQKTSEMLLIMKHGSPCLRVVMGLCQFGESLAYRADRPPTIGFGEGVIIPLTQDLLASLCGVSRTRFSEFVHQLRIDGWVRISYGKVELLRPLAWHKFAELQRDKSFSKINPPMEVLLKELSQCDVF